MDPAGLQIVEADKSVKSEESSHSVEVRIDRNALQDIGRSPLNLSTAGHHFRRAI